MSAIAPSTVANPMFDEIDDLDIGETITIESGPVSITGTVVNVFGIGGRSKTVIIETPDQTYEYRIDKYSSRLVTQ